MTIRPYQSSDETAVTRLWVDCGLVVPGNNPLRDIQRKTLVNPEWFLVGEVCDQVVATCMAGYEGHRGWINYLAVSAEHRRRGLASSMMQRAEELLGAAGCPKVNLQVRATNQRVIDFYRSIGFDVEQVVSMGKRLEVDPPYKPTSA